MKAVLLNASFAPSLINFRGPLIDALNRRGYSVHVTAPDFSDRVIADLRALDVTSHHLPLTRTARGPVSDLQYLISMYRLIRRIRPYYVINYTAKPNIWGSIAAGLAHVPSASMVTGLGLLFIDENGGFRAVTQKMGRWLYRLATQFNQRVGCLKNSAKAVLVNGSGVDTVRFSPVPLPPKPSFLLIARLLRTKGITEFVEAAELVRNVIPQSRFRIAGPIDSGPDSLPLSAIERWSDRGIEYLGTLEDVRPELAEASIYVLPSYREGTPRTVLEAMAMARPVITTDVPGCRQTVIDGVNGLLVEPRDAAALASAMIRMAADREMRERMAAAGREMAVQKYSAEKVNAVLLGELEL
jgi:glycosyltransferase involved in cell wall biosynthesis